MLLCSGGSLDLRVLCCQVHTNLHAAFKCDALKLAMIKNEHLAQRLFDVRSSMLLLSWGTKQRACTRQLVFKCH